MIQVEAKVYKIKHKQEFFEELEVDQVGEAVFVCPSPHSEENKESVFFLLGSEKDSVESVEIEEKVFKQFKKHDVVEYTGEKQEYYWNGQIS